MTKVTVCGNPTSGDGETTVGLLLKEYYRTFLAEKFQFVLVGSGKFDRVATFKRQEILTIDV